MKDQGSIGYFENNLIKNSENCGIIVLCEGKIILKNNVNLKIYIN
jgi:hypothetical protein